MSVVVRLGKFATLTVVQRSEQFARWAELAAKVSQVVTPSGGKQPKDEGIRKAAKELNIGVMDVQRAVKIASLTPEAKAVATEQE